VVGQDWLDAAFLHQFVKVLNGAPAAGIDAQAGDAEVVADFDALFGVLNLASDFGGVGAEKGLVGGEADQVDAVAETLAFELLQVRAMAVGERLPLGDVHLPVQNIHAGNAEVGGLINDRFDRNFRVAKMPVRIGAQAQLYWWFAGGTGIGA